MTTCSTDPVVRVLEHYWGFHEFRPLQREAIAAILDRRDSVVVLPTGGGKSLCFQAPALVADDAAPGRLALVVSPLIALMKDQVDELVASGVPAACLNSAQPPEARAAAVALVRSGACRPLYVSPERLVGDGSESFRDWVRQAGVRFIAIDEAHCISQWGHDFRPEYRRSAASETTCPSVSMHAFTATATPARARRHRRAARAARPASCSWAPSTAPTSRTGWCRAPKRVSRFSTSLRGTQARQASSTAYPAARWTRLPPGFRGSACGRSPTTRA